jgi:hypothetical protein
MVTSVSMGSIETVQLIFIIAAIHNVAFDHIIDDVVEKYENLKYFTISQTKFKPDFQFLRPLFSWFPAGKIRRIFDVTTQFARGGVSNSLKQHWRSIFPACNVKRHNETVATDTVVSDIPAVDYSVTAAQLFVGREYLVADVSGLKTDKEFVNTIKDNIRERVAMDKLISECSKA